ncbi:nucleoside phosphorylase domain-containing protein [Triangularia verruculosa]|uniref:Nucleoside phosphorylase domain-containing protein n=1 Tax=Triangularia verruculosa TaxID=2587418 RepID=A0AAN6X862_9PEZI|nr:nucleoside phosphorylase domain-containing protein [Triangularia verruculosa]
MVGIGGGAPSANNDIRLGDVVVSAPAHGKGGVLQYDFGKTIQGRSFQSTGHLNEPPWLFRTAMQGLQLEYQLNCHGLVSAIAGVLGRRPRLRREYKRPEPSTDKLFKASVVHRSPHANCQGVCDIDPNNLVRRSARTEEDDGPVIHCGLIASANQVMEDAEVRDQLIVSNGVLCFEMEAAGLMNHFPCLVVCGICKFSNSHENKEWQGYAAMTAAAYTKDILSQIPPSSVKEAEDIENIPPDG